MRIDSQDVATLLHMQEIDMQVIRTNKELEGMPERKKILDCRVRQRAVAEKAEQVEGLLAKAESKLTKLTDEDDGLAERQAKVQAEIDEVKGDFRSVQSRTKELSGIAKRRETLEEEMSSADAEVEKVRAVKAQIEAAAQKLADEEAAATKVFVEEGGKLKGRAAELKAERAGLASTVDAEALRVYERTARATGGVPMALLADDHCGACRCAIDHGRVSDMRRGGNVGTCPNCGRLLVLSAQ